MTLTSMASRFTLFLFFILTLDVFPLFAQDVTCPEGSTLKNDAVIFTISTTQQKLLPLLGDFYSPIWQEILFQVKITFDPPHRTIDYSPLTLTEALISSPNLNDPLNNGGFDLSWNLTSPAFTPPPLTSDHKVTYYTQTISVRPTCPDNTYSTIAWRTNVCISGTDAKTTLQWFTVQQRIAASTLFTGLARGWFGTIDSDPSGNNCEHFDTRVATLPTYQPSAVGDVNAPVPSMTETLSTTYAVIVGPGTTLSWPVGGTPTAIVRPVQNATSTSTVVMTAGESYIPAAGAARGKEIRVLGLVIGGLVGFVVVL